jgi:hypothetical protein
VAPIRFGPFAAKLHAAPVDPPDVPKSTAPDGLKADLRARLKAGPLAWDFGVQLWTDDAATPLEDPRVLWTTEASPVIPLARLEIAKQDVLSEAGVKLEAFIETLSFDPWHAPKEFQPLGAVMRARNPAYRVSTEQRAAASEPRSEAVPWLTRAGTLAS